MKKTKTKMSQNEMSQNEMSQNEAIYHCYVIFTKTFFMKGY